MFKLNFSALFVALADDKFFLVYKKFIAGFNQHFRLLYFFETFSSLQFIKTFTFYTACSEGNVFVINLYTVSSKKDT